MKKSKRVTQNQRVNFRVTLFAFIFTLTFLYLACTHIPRVHVPVYNPAIVKVITPDGGHGTGFYTRLDNNETILITAAHVCSTNKFLTSSDGVHIVLAVDPAYDTCILEASPVDDVLELADMPRMGDTVHILGFPHHLDYFESKGRVLRNSITTILTPTDQYTNGCPKNSIDIIEDILCMVATNVYETDAKVLPGNSGGPVMLNSDNGKVVGIVHAYDPGTGVGYFISVYDVKRVIRNWKAGEYNDNN